MQRDVELRAGTSLLDPEDSTEMARQMLQDRLLEGEMGGPLPEHDQQLPASMTRILDVGCGVGGWVLDAAFCFPHAEVVGMDASDAVVHYARARARAEGRSNAIFLQGNVLASLDEHPDASFDLVNARFLSSFVRRASWPLVLRELSRLLRPGGILRLTEYDQWGRTTSRATQQLLGWCSQTAYHLGYGFSSTGADLHMTPMLGPLLREVGCEQVCFQEHVLDISYGSQAYSSQRENYRAGFALWKPLLLQTGVTTRAVFNITYNCMLAETYAPTFVGQWVLTTAWGRKPEHHG